MNWKWPNFLRVLYISTYININYSEAKNHVEHALISKFIWRRFFFSTKLIVYNGTGQNIMFTKIFFKIRALKA